jgi:class 3 adenylate cyclase
MSFRPVLKVNSEVSAVLSAAWQIAAKEAQRAGDRQIHVLHLLIAVFSLDKLHANDFQSNDRAEYELVSKLLKETFMSGSEVRRILRAQLLVAHENDFRAKNKPSEKMSRSEELKQLFRSASENGQFAATVAHCLKILLDTQPQALDPFLKIPQQDVRDSVVAICEQLGALHTSREEDNESASVAISLDARKVEPLAVTGGDPFLRMIYELPAWAASDQYSAICAGLLKVFPSAESAAVVIENNRGDLLLKSGCPVRELTLSLRLVRQVMKSGRAQVWLRDDASASPIQSAGQAVCAMYAPVTNGTTAVGAIYVGTQSDRGNFNEEDLKRAAAIARHLGTCYENQRLRLQVEQQNRVLQRLLTNFSPAVRDKLLEMAGRGQLRLGGVRSEVSILCSDIRGFTRMSSHLDAEDVVDLLNEYFSVAVECIFKHGGTIDKFIGDAILAVFGSPVTDPDHPLHAIEAAVEMQKGIDRLNATRHASGLQTCNMGIGVHCGEVLHGFIGSRERMEYTVIGDTVNIASRLCDGAAESEILVSSTLHQHIWRHAICEECDVLTKHEGTFHAYRLCTNSNPQPKA